MRWWWLFLCSALAADPVPVNPHLDALSPPETCGGCHPTEGHLGLPGHEGVASTKTARRAKKAKLPLVDGAMGCTTCHTPTWSQVGVVPPTWWVVRGLNREPGDAQPPRGLRQPKGGLCEACHPER